MIKQMLPGLKKLNGAQLESAQTQKKDDIPDREQIFRKSQAYEKYYSFGGKNL